MSSLSSQTCGWRLSTSRIGRNCHSSYAAPLGLNGEFSSSQRVRGVIAASRSCACSRKPLSSVQPTGTGRPPAISTRSAHDVQYGAARITSSPGSSVAMKALCITCLAPAPALISSSAKSSPFSRRNLACTAAFSSAVPSRTVYRVCPERMARIAACLTWSGVSTSGSPAPRTMTGRPSRRRCAASAPMRRISGLRSAMRCARRTVLTGTLKGLP